MRSTTRTQLEAIRFRTENQDVYDLTTTLLQDQEEATDTPEPRRSSGWGVVGS